MEKSRIEEIAMAVAMVEYYQQIIDNAKDEIRNLTEEEVAKINKGNDLIIKRQNYTTSKRELITDKFTNMNKTQLKAASKNANIK